MPLSLLKIGAYGPFQHLELALDPQINLFVGFNNTGKTATLCAIAEIAVYPFSLPRHFLHGDRSKASLVHRTNQGRVSQHSSTLPITARSQKEKSRYQAFLRAIGFSAFLPALRVSTDYRSAGPTQSNVDRRRHNLSQARRNAVANDESGLFFDTEELHSLEAHLDSHNDQDSPKNEPEFFKRRNILETNARFVRDQDVIQRIIDLDYRFYRNNDRSIRAAMETIATVTSEITNGFEMRFVGVREDKRGLYIAIKTPYGEVPLNTLSQGTQSIFQWVSRLVMGMTAYYGTGTNILEQRGVVLVDEVDAHLHPTWQRQVLPTIRRHFRKLQIICTAHSPLMIAGLKTGQVHLFGRSSSGTVTVTQNQGDIVGWTSDQVYQEFLGIENPTDLETAHATERLATFRAKSRLTAAEKKEIEGLKSKIRQAALGSPPLQGSQSDVNISTEVRVQRRQKKRNNKS